MQKELCVQPPIMSGMIQTAVDQTRVHLGEAWPNHQKSSSWKCWNSSNGKAVILRRGILGSPMIHEKGFLMNIRYIIRMMLGFIGWLPPKLKPNMFKIISWSMVWTVERVFCVLARAWSMRTEKASVRIHNNH
jgi:hypothetical protein